MSHDQMCSNKLLPREHCLLCDLIVQIRIEERERAAQRISDIFWPTDGSWVTEETTLDAVGRASIAAVRGES